MIQKPKAFSPSLPESSANNLKTLTQLLWFVLNAQSPEHQHGYLSWWQTWCPSKGVVHLYRGGQSLLVPPVLHHGPLLQSNMQC